MRKVANPVSTGLRSTPDIWLVRRWRAIIKLLHVDAAARWRIAAHAAVLSLTAGVLVVSRLPSNQAAAATGASEDPWAGLAHRAGSLIPDMVVGTVPSTGGNRDASTSDAPGFVSPGAIAEADQALLPWDKPETHVVKYGDTLTSIAADFGIEPVWILWTNPEIRKNPHSIALGTELTVLPMRAVAHDVQDGETLAGIAEKYKARVEDIVGYGPNGLAQGEAFQAGKRLIVPEGESEITLPSPPKPILPRSVPAWAVTNGGQPVVGSGDFHAAAFGRFTSGFTRRHRGVDIANHTGTPIYAIDSGTVIIAGRWSWAGIAVKLDHGNGFSSLYAHMNSLAVSPGQSIQRGQVIGTIGCTRGYGGYCSGPHLHLEVYQQGVPVNPCAIGACN